MNLATKILVAATLVVGVWAGATITRWTHDDPDAQLLKKYERQVLINDSTVVLLAAERAEKKALKGLLTAANQLKGKLIAGAKVKIELETATGVTTGVAVPDSTSDSVKHWQFTDIGWKIQFDSAGAVKDSIKVGTLGADVWVTWPTKAQLTWSFRPEPLEPSIGFVKVLDRYLVAVTCALCKEVTVEAPFVDKAIKQERRLVKTVGAQYDFLGTGWIGRAGVDFRLVKGLGVGVEGRSPLRTLLSGESPQLLAGMAIRF